MTIVILNLEPAELPQIAAQLVAVFEAKGQAAIDAATAALSMRQEGAIEHE